MRIIRLFLMFSLAAIFLGGPARSADPKKATAKVTYDDHVKPLLADKCFACHNPDKKSGGLVLNSYTRVMEGSSSGVIVKPGDPETSSLYMVVAHKSEPFMPPRSAKMPDAFAMTLHRWIAGGCLENSGSKATIVNKPKIDIGLTTVTKGKPAGPPPMPTKSLPLEPIVKTAKANAVLALASSPWAPLVAVGGQKQVLLYNSDNFDLIGVLPFPEGTPHVLKFSRNGSLLLAGGGRGGHSGRVVVWSVLSGERIFAVGEETDCVLAADISPDQTQIALGGPGKMLRIYSTKDGKALYEIKKHTDWITSMEYSPDGVLLATADRNGGMFIWEAYTGREYFALRGHTASITEVSWRADSNLVASTSEDSSVRLYEMENGNQVRTWNTGGGGGQGIAYCKDGRLVTATRDRTVKLWDGNGALQRAFAAMPDVALRAVFTHDGARVIGTDWTGQVIAWDAKDGKQVGLLLANPPSIVEQLANAQKELVARQTARDAAVAAAKASLDALQKTQAELVLAQKAIGDSAIAARAAVEGVPKAKAVADAARAALALAQNDVKAKTDRAKTLTDAASKAKEVAAKAPADAKAAEASAKAGQASSQAAAEVVQAQKVLAEKTVILQNADKAFTAAQQAVAPAQAAMVGAPKRVEALQASIKALTPKVAADQANATAAVAAYNQGLSIVEKWKAAAATPSNKTASK